MSKAPEPERSCIATGVKGERDELLRFVCSPDGKVVFDLHAKLPGRGIWLVPKRSAIESAVTKKLFSRAAKEKAEASASLTDHVQQSLRRHALELLSLCRKSGDVVAGFEKVKEAFEAHPNAVWLHASDAGEDGKAKLEGRVREEAVTCFTRDELAEITGRDNPVHVALLPSGMTSQFLRAARRLTGFEG